MTKRVMTKKFMKETCTDKKTAMEYLRKCQWNYGAAKTLYYAVKDITEKIIELVQSEEFQTACNAVIAEKTKKEGDGNEMSVQN